MAAGAAFFLFVAACAPPANRVASIQSPTPSPSPTPTAPLAATAPGFHMGEVGLAYAPVTLSATGGVAPYNWSVSHLALPDGLALSSDGSISGTPSRGGQFAFTLTVADAGGSSTTVDGKIVIADALAAHLIPVCASYCNVELGCADACGSFGTVSGGVGPYTYSVTQGPLPAGTSLNGLSLAGTFKGSSGWLQFTVQVSDALGVTATISPKFWMYPHISVGGGQCMGGFGTGCKAQLQISGGLPNDSFAVKLVANNPPGPNQGCGSYGQPPPGSLAVSGSSVVVAIPGNLSSGYGAIWTIQVTDSALCGTGTNCASNDATVVIEVQCS